MRKVIFPLIVVILALGLVLGCTSPAPEPSPTPSPSPSPSPSPTSTPAPEPVKFKAVVFEAVTARDIDGFREYFVPMMNEEFGDYIEIELIGGTEVVPPFQQHSAWL